MPYTLYVLRCADGTFYTGIALDLQKRLGVHQQGNGSKYVRSRLPFTLVHTEIHTSKADALRRESEIKSWSRQQKIANLNLG